jgi:hypothetical protein
VLHAAFANLYGYDMTAELNLILRNRRGEESTRKAEIARKRIDGRVYSIGRFTEPDWMRGTSSLVIENADRSDDHFLFLPALDRVRRISSVQRSDAFLGTDLSYEDLERRRAEDYSITAIHQKTVGSEDFWVVFATPTDDGNYASVEFTIAKRDHLLMKTDFFKRSAEIPFKTIEVPSRSSVISHDGHVIPKELIVSNRQRGSVTEVRFEKLRVNPELSDSLFTSAALESGRAVPGLSN